MPSLAVPVGFGRANCAVTQQATGPWQTVSSGVHVCLLVHQNRESFGEIRCWNRPLYCICDLCRLVL